jgi:hypothetical protein
VDYDLTILLIAFHVVPFTPFWLQNIFWYIYMNERIEPYVGGIIPVMPSHLFFLLVFAA